MIGMVLYGHYRGFLKQCVSLGALVLTIVIVKIATPYMTGFIKDNPSIRQGAADAILSIAGWEEPSMEDTGLPSAQRMSIERLNLPQSVKDVLLENNNSEIYKILGVDRQASTEQIKKAYRSLAKKYHPDVVKDDKAKQERMYEIQEAYACLENEERRKKYDAECLKSPRNTVNAGEKVKNGRTSFGEKSPDMGQFERFFGFQPGRGMETYQDHRSSKPEGPIKPEEMFAAFFGRGSMQEAEKRNAAGSKRKNS